MSHKQGMPYELDVIALCDVIGDAVAFAVAEMSCGTGFVEAIDFALGAIVIIDHWEAQGLCDNDFVEIREIVEQAVVRRMSVK